MRIYLASPLGFAESTRHFMDQLAGRLRERAEVLNPWDNTEPALLYPAVKHLPSHPARLHRWREINTGIGRANTSMIDTADTIVAVLDGVDVDSGTAAEIGYGFATGKRIYGLRTDFRQTGENEGALVNLQVRYFIDASGGDLLTSVEELLLALFGND